MRTLRNAMWAGLSVLLASGAAYGSFIPQFVSATPGPAANTTFTYDLNFSTGLTGTGQPIERLEQGDFVTIYDILGFVSAAAPAGFNVTTQNVGVDGFSTTPNDDAALVNVTYSYTGATVTTNTNFTGATIVSSFGNFGLVDNFTSEVTHNVPPLAGQPIGQIGFVPVPGIPEPGVLNLASLGLFTLVRRTRR